MRHSPVPLGPARRFSLATPGKLSSPPTEGAPGPEPPLLLAAASRGAIPLSSGRPDTRAPGFNSPPGLVIAAPSLSSRSRLGVRKSVPPLDLSPRHVPCAAHMVMVLGWGSFMKIIEGPTGTDRLCSRHLGRSSHAPSQSQT
ncbi:hypothetical protein NDU88_001931 [Pleurodeles waltl]|uniref:Uncharacterized protein n=1 Tax=Pleurodeles waltl TaxID=8319 RepID=A0AAV7VBF4_PLEWA|nr:hypothetical protein NDU88_001931 [Pleurodeles waltl]